MVISFSNDRAWEHLQEEGFVATFRPKRKRPNCKTWANRGRGEEKEFDVLVTETAEVVFGEDEKALSKFDDISGFGSKTVWKSAIRELHGELPEKGYVYLVKKI